MADHIPHRKAEPPALWVVSDPQQPDVFLDQVVSQLRKHELRVVRARNVFDLVKEVGATTNGTKLQQLNLVGHGGMGYLRIGSPRDGAVTMLDARAAWFPAVGRLRDYLDHEKGPTLRLLGCHVGLNGSTGSGGMLQLALAYQLNARIVAALGSVDGSCFRSPGGFDIDDGDPRMRVFSCGQPLQTGGVPARPPETRPRPPLLDPERVAAVAVRPPPDSPLGAWSTTIYPVAQDALKNLLESIRWDQTWQSQALPAADVELEVTFQMSGEPPVFGRVMLDQTAILLERNGESRIVALDRKQFRAALPAVTKG